MKQDESENNLMLKHLIDSQPIDDYESRSIKEIHYLVYDPFCQNSPLTLTNNLDAFMVDQIPIFRLINFYLELLSKNEPFKLNKNGELSPKIIKTIQSQDFFQNDFEPRPSKMSVLSTEPTSVSCARIISELAGLSKMRKNEITLTRKGKRILDNSLFYELFYEIFLAYTTKFNWSYLDDFGDNDIGQFGFAYTLDLISRYGKIMHNYKFYADKYKQAFGFALFKTGEGNNQHLNEFYEQCFFSRTIERFLKWFGLAIFTDGSGIATGERYILKSKIFETLLSFD